MGVPEFGEGTPFNARMFYPHTEEDVIAEQAPHDFWPETGEEFKYPGTSKGGVAILGAQQAIELRGDQATA